MNIKGIGTDIIEIKRIKKAIERRSEALINKIFTKEEKEYCTKFKDTIPHFAARFAAKEAFVKALGIGFGKEIFFKDIEIVNNSNGKPIIKFSERLNKKFLGLKIYLSISHSEDYAIAFCIIQ